MKTRNAGLPQAFVERQRERLLALREELIGGIEVVAREEAVPSEGSVDEPLEAAEQADKRMLQENGETLVALNRQRLGDVERALKRIDHGTYGLSIASNAPIPKARLDAVPEAAYTMDEEAEREKNHSA
jgi:DnaK suppressor protein